MSLVDDLLLGAIPRSLAMTEHPASRIRAARAYAAVLGARGRVDVEHALALGFYGDGEYAAWVASAAKNCRCCPICSCGESPCAGALAGGVCDLVPCRCDDDGGRGDDESQEEYE